MNLPSRNEVAQLRREHRRYLPVSDPAIEQERRFRLLCAACGFVVFLMIVAVVVFILCAWLGL